MKYWAIWGRRRADPNCWFWLDYVYRARFSKSRASVYGRKLLRMWHLKGFRVVVLPFESDAVRPLQKPDLFNSK